MRFLFWSITLQRRREEDKTGTVINHDMIDECATSPLNEPPRGAVKVNPIDGAEMVYVPAGEFVMGADDPYNLSLPHRVYLDGFWIYKNHVTVEQYRSFCEAEGRDVPSRANGRWQDEHPIVWVTWNDAVAYADWANASLPTEAQWEKAAVGTDRRKFPWGNRWDPSRCVHSKDKLGDLGSTMPVGSCPSGASPYGVLDMAGNVNDWCADRFDLDYYKVSPLRNPTGPATASVKNEIRSVRGGDGTYHLPAFLRSARRNSLRQKRSYSVVGFRCAMAADDTEEQRMAARVIEGTWEDINRYESEIVGRHLRVTIFPSALP